MGSPFDDFGLKQEGSEAYQGYAVTGHVNHALSMDDLFANLLGTSSGHEAAAKNNQAAETTAETHEASTAVEFTHVASLLDRASLLADRLLDPKGNYSHLESLNGRRQRDPLPLPILQLN